MTQPRAVPLQPREVARVLSEIATLLELNGRDPFRARAFASAARFLEGTDADLVVLARESRLTELRGVGPAIALIVAEIVDTGRAAVHEELQAATPVGLFELLRVPGLGAKRIHTIHAELGVASLDDLESAARAGRIAALPGFGAKTEARILDGLAFARSIRAVRRYPDALEIGARMLDWLLSQPSVTAAELVGPLRRRLEVVNRVDLVAATERPADVHAAFAALNGVEGVEGAEGAEGAEGGIEAMLSDGLPVRLRCVAPAELVAAVAWDTGSDPHVEGLAAAAAAAGFVFDRRGLWKGDQRTELADEAAIYTALGLGYIPPELREGLGEIEAAADGHEPTLVTITDLTGTFHCHTTFSDGKATLDEMAGAAAAKDWSYLGIADHSRVAAYARGLTIERVREQHEAIDAWNAARTASGASEFRIFKGIESDILPDGRLDYPDEVLATFDFIVGSVHSSFGMTEEEMTARVIRAVRHPALTILGHATGRLLLTREGYALDVPAVIDAAAETGVVIEINSNPHRLDLDWRDVRYAAERGVLIAINPDAHSVKGLDHVIYGVNMARKAGLAPHQILNCWTFEEVDRYLAARKQAIQD
jgi:DNA polymerase (family 10)